MDRSEFDVLIIDDDPGILDLLMHTFEESSLRVLVAENVAQARTELERHSFRIVLCDYHLPDGNGVDFLTEIRAHGEKSLPILMTGVADLNIAIEAINRGKVHKFVTKPLDLVALTQTIFRALDTYIAQREQERMTQEVLASNVRLQHEARRNEQDLRLAADRIREVKETVERQKAEIEALQLQIQRAYLHAITSLTAAIEARDKYTSGHSGRVFYYCSLMADILGLPEQSRTDLRFASILHDIGKIGIPDSILNKPAPLTPEERGTMASHLALTEAILEPLPFLDRVRRIIREHHEHFDGSGYNAGLKAEQISIEGRILAVADTYDAMRSNRAYRKALSKSQALAELKRIAGTQLCPLCVGALLYGIETRDECSDEEVAKWEKIPWDQEFMRLRPASDFVEVESIRN